MVDVSRRLGPGPATIDGLRWLARVGPAPIDAWACAMGWAVPTAKSHAARLKRERWIDRVARPHGDGSLIFATRQGVQVAGVDVAALAGASADLVGSPGGVRVGRCVADRPRARDGRSSRADRGSVVAGRGESRARVAATGSHAGSRRHRAGPASGGDRGRVGAEVEGSASRDPRPVLAVDSERQVGRVCLRVRERATSASSWSPKPSTSGSARRTGVFASRCSRPSRSWSATRRRAVPRGTRLAKGADDEPCRVARRRLRDPRAGGARRALRVDDASLLDSVGAESLRAGRNRRSRARGCARGPRVDTGDGAGASGRVLRLRRAVRQAAAAGGPWRRRGASLL